VYDTALWKYFSAATESKPKSTYNKCKKDNIWLRKGRDSMAGRPN